jgi:nephrocystin-3
MSRSIRIFLSSTFRDYGEERDLLVRKVFPNLRAKLKDRFIELVDVDLRWGITVEQAERGEVLPICLAEIDRARPYFVGMLGDRYGWIPPPDAYAFDLVERQPWLDSHRGGKSVTELEMLHGVLNNPKMAGRALFYFRSSSYAKQKGGDYLPESLADHVRQQKLKAKISKYRFPVVRYRDPEAFAKRLEKDLWKLLDKEFPASSVPDAFTREGLKHESYASLRRRLYLGGDQYLATLSAGITKKQSKILIEGASGSGKSALLANWLQSYRKDHPKHLIFEYYLGASTDSADPAILVRRLIETIKRTTVSDEEIAGEPHKLYDSIPTWLATASSYADKRKTQWVLAIDSLNSLSDLKDLRWLPEFLPPHITLIISTLPGEVKAALLTKVSSGANVRANTKAKSKQSFSRNEGWQTLQVKPLTSAQRKNLLVTYLAKYNKTLAPTLVKQALAHRLANNPLFLITLAEELRLFGVHEELQKRLNQYLSSKTIDDLFERVLKRVEGDSGKESVQHAMQAIWASRAGLTEKEILAIVKLKPASWAPIRNALDECLLESSGKIGFAHDYMRIAVKDRYLKSKALQKQAHINLAKYFQKQPADVRRVEEEPYQWQAAGEWESLKRCLIDYGMFKSIVENFNYRDILSYWLYLIKKDSIKLDLIYKTSWNEWSKNNSGIELAEVGSELMNFLRFSGYTSKFLKDLSFEILSIFEKNLPLNAPRIVSFKTEIGMLLEEQGLIREAIEMVRGVAQIQRKFRGKEQQWNYSVTLNLMATMVSDDLNPEQNCDEAVLLFNKVIKIREKIYGIDDITVATVLNNYSLLLGEMGRSEDGLEVCRRAFDIRRRKLGLMHEQTLTSMNNMATLMESSGNQFEAEKYLQQVIQLRSEVLGRIHPRTARSINNLAVVFADQNRYEDAQTLYKEALEIRKKCLPSGHPDIARSMTGLARVYRETGKFDRALELYKNSVTLYQNSGLGQSNLMLRAINNMAEVMSESGDSASALEMYSKALQICLKINGENHPHTEICLSNMALSLQNLDRYEESIKVQRRGLKITRKLYDENSEQVADSIYYLADTIFESGDSKEAINLMLKELEISKKISGKVSGRVSDSLHLIGVWCRESNRFKESSMWLEKATTMRAKIFGKNSPKVASSLSALGKLRMLEGKFSESEALLKRSLEMYKSLPDVDESDIQSGQSRLNELYKLWGRDTQIL